MQPKIRELKLNVPSDQFPKILELIQAFALQNKGPYGCRSDQNHPRTIVPGLECHPQETMNGGIQEKRFTHGQTFLLPYAFPPTWTSRRYGRWAESARVSAGPRSPGAVTRVPWTPSPRAKSTNPISGGRRSMWR